MTTPPAHRRRRVVVLTGLALAVAALRLLSSCAAGDDRAGARLAAWSTPASCTTCSSPQVPGPTE